LFDEKHLKLGLTIFAAIVVASLVLNLFQRSANEKAVMQHYNMMKKVQQQQVEQIKSRQQSGLQNILAQDAAERKLYNQQLNTYNQWQNNQNNAAYEREQSRIAYSKAQSERLKANSERWQQNKIDNRKERDRIYRRNKSESAARQSIRSTNDKTCAFWRDRVRKNNNEYNQNQLNSACSRAAND